MSAIGKFIPKSGAECRFDLDDDWEPESWEDELEELDDESWQDYDPLDDQ